MREIYGMGNALVANRQKFLIRACKNACEAGKMFALCPFPSLIAMMIEPSLQERQCDNPPLSQCYMFTLLIEAQGFYFFFSWKKYTRAWPNFKALVLFFAENIYLCDEKGKCRGFNLPTHENNLCVAVAPQLSFHHNYRILRMCFARIIHK